MKITIVTAAWQRPKCFELSLKNWTALEPRPTIAVVGSPEDPESERLAKEYGCLFSLSDNAPLGKKWNDAVEFACKSVGEGYFQIQGSDDLISQKMWDYYQNFNGDYLCLRDFYFYHIQSRQYLHWKGFSSGRRKDEPIGTGKLMRYDFLEKIGFRPFDNLKARALDYAVHASMLKAGAKPTLIRQSDTGGINIDLKDGLNMNKFQKWGNSQYIHFRHIQEQHPDVFNLIQHYPT